jgi:Tol biopolymer transport system component
MWLQDMRNGTVLAVANHIRLGIRGLEPGGKEEHELGWFGWAQLHGITGDGRKILFDEEGDGGGPNYTVFLRDTDGSPPARIGEGTAKAISSDGKWVITKPSKGGQLLLVPAGAGEARQLTHDSVSYSSVHFLPDGKRVLASGIEAGHGGRDYLIELSNGDSKPLTPEGTAGVVVSPDGKNTAVRGPDGTRGFWPIEGGGFHPLPGVDSHYSVIGWTADSQSVYVVPSRRVGQALKTIAVSRVNIQTGKMEPWKTFGGDTGAGVSSVIAPQLSNDGAAYAYLYTRVLSEAYVVTGLK